MNKQKKNRTWPFAVLAVVTLLALSLAAVLLLGGIGTEDQWQEQYDLGCRYLEEGNYEEAILAFSAAIEIDPRRAEAYLGRGEAYMELGEYEKAQEDFEKARRRAEDDEEIEEKIKELDELLKQQDIPDEEDCLAFIRTFPEYRYYALLDINTDGVPEILVSDKIYDDAGLMYDEADLFVFRDDDFYLAVDDIWTKIGTLRYDPGNQWIECFVSGTGGSGRVFLYLDEQLRVQETSFGSYCMEVDESGNEVWDYYYNDIQITDGDMTEYDALIARWKAGTPEDIALKPIPRDTSAFSDSYVHSIPLGVSCSYDMNGDGTAENILVEDLGESTILTIGSVSEEYEYFSVTPTGYYTIIDIYGDGSELLLGISDWGPSEDHSTELFAYDGTSIINVGWFDAILGETTYGEGGARIPGDGTIEAYTRMDVLGSWNANALYRYEDQALWNVTEFYSCCGYGEETSWEVTTKCAMVMYKELWDYDEQVPISAETVVRMTGCVMESSTAYWVAFESDAFEGTLWAYVTTDSWPQMVHTPMDMISSEDAFDGFYFAG